MLGLICGCIVIEITFIIKFTAKMSIFSRYGSFAWACDAQCCWRTNKRPTCVPDFEKHPPLFIGTSYTPELPFPTKSVSFTLKNETCQRGWYRENWFWDRSFRDNVELPFLIHPWWKSMNPWTDLLLQKYFCMYRYSRIHLRLNFHFEETVMNSSKNFLARKARRNVFQSFLFQNYTSNKIRAMHFGGLLFYNMKKLAEIQLITIIIIFEYFSSSSFFWTVRDMHV